MNVFPQLVSGAIHQEALKRRFKFRTVVSEVPSGRRYRYSDTGGSVGGWRLTFDGLVEQERQALETLFAGCIGRLRRFTFLDARDNLMRFSEDFSNAVWVKDSSIQTIAGQADPWGTIRATRVMNVGQAPARLWQVVEGPGWFRYVASMHAKAPSPAVVTLFVETDDDGIARAYDADDSWRRRSLSCKLATEQEWVRVGVELAPGSDVAICGLQLEAQVVEGDYKLTTSKAGVYPNARFAQDEIVWTCTGPDSYRTVVDMLEF